ncbi:hypothetical protein [Lysobacter humi (ex Lee et al. 2017)]
MFGLFRRSPRAARITRVWRDAEARLAGLAAEAGRADRPMLIAVRDAAALDGVAQALRLPAAAIVDDGYALADALDRRDGGPYVTRVDGLLRRAPTKGDAGPQVHVVGVGTGVAEDARLMEALAWHDGPVVVHAALDDALLARIAPQIGALVDRLGVARDVPIESPLVDRAIERAQRRAG